MLTPTHLVFAQTAYLGACVVAAHPPAPEEAALALISGWVSHAWADMMTKSGVAWFWPARIRCVLPGNPDYRMEVARGGELAFLLVVALIGVVLMPLAATSQGTAGLIRGAIGDLATVRAARIEVATLRDQAVVLGTVGEVVLVGSAQAEGVRPQPPTLEVSGDRLTFVYADPAQLDALAGRSLAQVAAYWAAVLQYFQAPHYYTAEREARRAGLGIWSEDGDWQRPWVHRRRYGVGSAARSRTAS